MKAHRWLLANRPFGFYISEVWTEFYLGLVALFVAATVVVHTFTAAALPGDGCCIGCWPWRSNSWCTRRYSWP